MSGVSGVGRFVDRADADALDTDTPLHREREYNGGRNSGRLVVCCQRVWLGAELHASQHGHHRHAAARQTACREDGAIRALAATKSLCSLAAALDVSHETIRAVVRHGRSATR
jgi:hypothetical protein